MTDDTDMLWVPCAACGHMGHCHEPDGPCLYERDGCGCGGWRG